MKAALRPFNRRHEQLMRRAKIAPKGQREDRQNDLVLFVALGMATPAQRRRLLNNRRRA